MLRNISNSISYLDLYIYKIQFIVKNTNIINIISYNLDRGEEIESFCEKKAKEVSGNYVLGSIVSQWNGNYFIGM